MAVSRNVITVAHVPTELQGKHIAYHLILVKHHRKKRLRMK